VPAGYWHDGLMDSVSKFKPKREIHASSHGFRFEDRVTGIEPALSAWEVTSVEHRSSAMSLTWARVVIC
jgi:hypothetical protein